MDKEKEKRTQMKGKVKRIIRIIIIIRGKK